MTSYANCRKTDFNYIGISDLGCIKVDNSGHALITAMASFRDTYLITGHKNGEIVLWQGSRRQSSECISKFNAEITCIFVDELLLIWIGNKIGMVSVYSLDSNFEFNLIKFLENDLSVNEIKPSNHL